MNVRLTAFLVSITCVPPVSAQLFGGASQKFAVADLDKDCDTVARVAKHFLSSRGLNVFLSNGKTEEDWTCGNGDRCIVFKAAKPRNAEGGALGRTEVVRDYLEDSAKADFRAKNLKNGGWSVPNRNFDMGASLRLRSDASHCSAKLSMAFGLGGMFFWWILPYDNVAWQTPADNGRLQTEYMTAIVKELER